MICALYKLRISSCIDSDRQLTPSVSRHLDHCAACRAFADASIEIGDRLALDASRVNNPAIYIRPEKVQEMPVFSFRLAGAIALAACLVLAVGVVLLNDSGSGSEIALEQAQSTVQEYIDDYNEVILEPEMTMNNELAAISKTLEAAADHLLATVMLDREDVRSVALSQQVEM